MRYVEYESTPGRRLPKMAVAVRLSDRPQDLVVCAALSAEYNGEEPRRALVNAQQHVAKPRNALFVATGPDGGIVGYARISYVTTPPNPAPDSAPEGYYLGGMVIDPRFRRRGVGTRLTTERLKFIANRSADAWYLVNKDNRASIALHVAHDFHETTREFTFPGVVFDGPGGILCHKRLDESATRCRGCP
ncbi:ribosomal protein S18 acetylase RimI-like enzyme [Stackebrandtia albiflava]|uniref:Ribosomal protein S18 acetylase RimI-like enzyme n=1 Tax=Stackebrandtia albiflava TaxID=406432 RepID=A0A562V5B3_9ACTN|nr:GNAT family N-acetyltransferase [Stackebrandtia albiflava]TWJ13063.1 ribosomal protein S18 acetylase RimI-like enzyme [Stackebrandtia albiflava]